MPYAKCTKLIYEQNHDTDGKIGKMVLQCIQRRQCSEVICMYSLHTSSEKISQLLAELFSS